MIKQQVTKNAVVELQDTSKVYWMGPNEIHALRGINLKIHPREFVVVLGPSGSGKTTLLNIIGGIDKPTTGKVIVNGKDLTRMSRGELTRYRRDEVGFIFQFFNLIPSLTALENVEYALQIQGKKNSKEIAIDALKKVGLGDRLDHFPSELSGGEQQRVAIARAIAKDPTIILADEPTGELDFETGMKILELLLDLVRAEENKHVNRAIIVVTHNTEIARMADRIMRLRSGRIISDEINESPVKPHELEW